MFGPKFRALFFTLPLSLLMACVGPGTSRDGTVRVQLQGTFQKQLLTPSGLGAVTESPARYAYAEIRAASGDTLLASGYLGADGGGSVDLSPDTRVYLRVFAAYEVPVTTGSGFFMRGSVVNASYFTSTPFANTSDWYVDSDAVVPTNSGTLGVRANLINSRGDRLAGAFNIADQAVNFALKVRDLEPTLRLPNLHTYWTTSSSPNDQTRTYPVALFDSAGKLSVSTSGRALFTHGVYGLQNGGAWTESDEWDDGTLVETFSHLLFANYSLLADGSSPLSLLRLDNENSYVSRYRPSEPSIGFAGGFCDFFAGAALNTPQLLDSYRNGSGVFTVENFDLGRHDQIDSNQRTEFTRGSIATTLWGIWKGPLGGNPAGLQTLWQSVRSNTAIADGTGQFNASALACYPTFLTGLQARAAGSWTAILGQLAEENIPAPDGSYFSGTDLWTTVSIPMGPVTGNLRCYVKTDERYYDYAPWVADYTQALNYRFVLGAARSVTVTMTPQTSQDFELDVLGPQGWVGSSYKSPFGGVRTLNLASLPAGAYVVRVRVNPDAPSSNGTFPFRLSIN
jgi:hypothetical protein